MTDKQKYIIRKSSEKIHEIRNMLKDALNEPSSLAPNEFLVFVMATEKIDEASKQLQTINPE